MGAHMSTPIYDQLCAERALERDGLAEFIGVEYVKESNAYTNLNQVHGRVRGGLWFAFRGSEGHVHLTLAWSEHALWGLQSEDRTLSVRAPGAGYWNEAEAAVVLRDLLAADYRPMRWITS